MSSDLQPVLDELAAMRGIIELLASLPTDARPRILVWLTSVITPAVVPALSAAVSASSRSAAGGRLAERIEQLNRSEAPEIPEAGERDEADKPRASLWRSKHT